MGDISAISILVTRQILLSGFNKCCYFGWTFASCLMEDIAISVDFDVTALMLGKYWLVVCLRLILVLKNLMKTLPVGFIDRKIYFVSNFDNLTINSS